MIPSPAKLSRLVSTCRPFRNASMLALSLALTVVATRPAQAQTFTVLHTFTGGQDGASPDSGLTLDRAGHLYGTTTLGANGHCLGGCGTVFRISSAGVLTTLYRFNGNDGDFPQANVTVASDGVLYGTTEFGGVYGAGNIYTLQQHLNHKSITTTELYLAFLTPEEAAAAKSGPSQSPAQPERFENAET